MGQLTPDAAVALESVFLVVAFVSLILRLYVRSWLQARFDACDALITGSFLCFLVCNILDGLTYETGLWKFDFHVTPEGFPSEYRETFADDEKLEKVMRIFYFGNIPFYSALWLIKFAFVRYFYNLVSPSMPRFRLFLHTTTVITVGAFFVSLFVALFSCKPLSANWDVIQPPSTGLACFSAMKLSTWIVFVVCHLITDLLIYALAFLLLPTLRASTSGNSLAGLITVYSLGGICIAITIARVVHSGLTMWLPSLAVWAAAEQASAIVVACTPPLKWLLTSLRENGITASRGTLADGSATSKRKKPDVEKDQTFKVGGGFTVDTIVEGSDVAEAARSLRSGQLTISTAKTGHSTEGATTPVVSVRSERVLSIEDFERRKTHEMVQQWRSSRPQVGSRDSDESDTLRTLRGLDGE